MSSDIRRKKASVKRKTPDSEGEGTPSPPRRPRLAPDRRGQHVSGRTLRRSPRIAGKNTVDGMIQRPGTPLAQPDEPEELEAIEEPLEPAEPAEPGYPGDLGEPEEPGENGEVQDRRGQQGRRGQRSGRRVWQRPPGCIRVGVQGDSAATA